MLYFLQGEHDGCEVASTVTLTLTYRASAPDGPGDGTVIPVWQHADAVPTVYRDDENQLMSVLLFSCPSPCCVLCVRNECSPCTGWQSQPHPVTGKELRSGAQFMPCRKAGSTVTSCSVHPRNHPQGVFQHYPKSRGNTLSCQRISQFLSKYKTEEMSKNPFKATNYGQTWRMPGYVLQVLCNQIV